MSKGYEQFFKNAKQAAEGKPAVPPMYAKKPMDRINKSSTATITQRKRKAKPFPVGAFIFSVMGFSVAFFGYQNYEKLSMLFSSVEISLFAPAHAEEEKAPKQEAKTEHAEPTKPVTAEPSGEELNHLIKLVDRKKELDAREEELNRMESELSKQKDDLQKRISELEKMRSSISNILEEKVKADDQKIDTLVQFYSNMKPPQAAKIFESIDEDLAVQILGRMKKKNAADVLNLMKPEKAQMFTEKFAGYKRSTASSSKPEAKPEDTTPAEEPETASKP